MAKNQDETIALDASAKDMSKYYRPDFRAQGNSFSTLGHTNEHEREVNFKNYLSPNVILSDIHKRPQSRTQAGSHTKLSMKEPYIDHLEEVGKTFLARQRIKTREISP